MTRMDGTTLTIDGLSAAGEGTVLRQGTRITVPFALPGEAVRVALPARSDRPARLLERLGNSPDRAEPPCPHFGHCGGCAVQHMSAAAQGRWKAARIATALERQGVEAPPFAPTFRSPPGDRRRAALAFRRLRGGTVLGFQARGSQEIVDMRTCFILTPALVELVPMLRVFLNELLTPGEGGDATMLAGDNGVDLRLDLPAIPDLAGLERLAGFAHDANLARLGWRVRQERGGADKSGHHTTVPIAQRRPVGVRMGPLFVEVGPGNFLQASAAAQAFMTDAVMSALDGVSPVLDLFSGAGTFSLPLACRGTVVHAVEGDAAALAALGAAARRAALVGLTTERRDLTRRPLTAAELNQYGGVVFDPPRAGAGPQAAEIARSIVPHVVAVSCNPASFARDAALLQGGGYRMTGLQPVDQFIWSAHIEIIATFRRQTA